MSDRRNPTHGDLVLGRYRIMHRLAAGGMGVVYLARIEGAEGFARPAVIKQMLPSLTEDEELVRLFVREAQIMSQLRHPGIVSVLDFATEHNAYLMVLEYVHGYHLGHWLKFHRIVKRAFAAELAIHIMVKVLEALDYVHTRRDGEGQPLGIVHRDISPSNVLLDVDGHVRLLDFGVARMHGEATQVKSGEISLKGKFPYMAPELLGQGAPSVSSDIYAAGVVLHELLLGRNEFKRVDATETFRRVLMHKLSSIEKVRHDVPKGMDRILRKATARHPSARHPSAIALATDLRKLLKTPDTALRQTLTESVQQDFFGALPVHLELEPLDELERRWRAPAASSAAISLPTADPTGVKRQANLITEPRVEPQVETSTKARSYLWPVAAIAGLALVGALASLAAIFAPRREPQRVIVFGHQDQDQDQDAVATAPVDAQPTPAPPDGDEALEASRPDEAAATSASNPPSPGPGTERHRRRPPRAGGRLGDINRRFRRRRARIERCVDRHTTGAAGTPRLELRLSIGRDGRVLDATLRPPALNATPLGRCIAQVAQSIRFAQQPSDTSIMIPIELRARR